MIIYTCTFIKIQIYTYPSVCWWFIYALQHCILPFNERQMISFFTWMMEQCTTAVIYPKVLQYSRGHLLSDIAAVLDAPSTTCDQAAKSENVQPATPVQIQDLKIQNS